MRIVSLTTDFGIHDYYAGELKALLYNHIPNVKLVDISHSIEPFDIVQAAFFLSNTYQRFPEATIHVVAVQSYYDVAFKLIFFKRDGHYFIGPDNGIFSLIWPDLDASSIFEVPHLDQPNLSINNLLSHTVAMIHHDMPYDEIGTPVKDYTRKIYLQPVITKDQIRASIIHIDRFDNVIVNLTKETFEKVKAGRQFRLFFKRNDPIHHIQKYYSDVPIGDVVALFNSSGYLEIAVNMGRASTLYNLNKNEAIQIYFDE